MTPDTPSPEGEFAKLVDEQLELAAARIPALAPAVEHPSPVDHEERAAVHANFEDVLLGNAEPSPEMLEELAALQAAPELSEEELARQALAGGGADTLATDLVISRLLNAPRAALWRAWADPGLLKLWWCPRPWTTEVRAFDMRAGGAFHTFMRGPDGGSSDNPGSFVEVLPQSRIVFTSMLTAGWRPATPWMPFTAIITMADEGPGTRYIATVMHPDQATRDRHEELGFFGGWNTCIDQLEALALQPR